MMYSDVHTEQVKDFSSSFSYKEKVSKFLANSVSSTPRASQLPVPPVIVKGDGSIVTDQDNNHYIDYTLGYGPLLLGHSPAVVIDAVKDELAAGLRTATVHAGEGILAQMISESVPCAEVSSFVSSGTEAVQLALRIARAYTGKTQIIKFRANYHGWFDSIHVANTMGSDGPSSQGQDPLASESLVLLDWGNIQAFEEVISSDFAAVILEVFAINAGCFVAQDGFLEKVRELTKKHKVVLIFDEVITGFRLSLGGAQAIVGITPDITVLGKALGAGFPISAVSGQREFMLPLIDGRVLHRGTFNGNPVSVAAAISSLKFLKQEERTLYPRINKYAREIQQYINDQAIRNNISVCANCVGSAVQIFCGTRAMHQIQDLPNADRVAILKLTQLFVENGLMPLPRGLMYLSAAHTDKQISATKEAITRAMYAYSKI